MAVRHRYFYTVNGRRVEELIDGKWLPVAQNEVQHSHNIIRDSLGEGVKGIWNPATNQRYDSRSKYLADTKAAGCEVVGNDHVHGLKGPGVTKSPEPLHQTIDRLNQQKGWNL